jgi:hypothetical protein
MSYISIKLRRRVIRVAENRCEYCRAAQEMTLATFHLDHVIPQVAGGTTVFENLCLSCPFCNQFKGEQWRARDPETRRLVTLFHPRRDHWAEHFEWSRDGTVIVGLTSRGRATVNALQLNNPISLIARRFWVASGIHPPE